MHNGNVYAGGRFIFSGDLPLVHIAKWDREKWHALGMAEIFRTQKRTSTGTQTGAEYLAVETRIYEGSLAVETRIYEGNLAVEAMIYEGT